MKLATITTIPFFGKRPEKKHTTDAGYDLSSGEATNTIIPAGERAFVRTSTWIGVPVGHVGMVCPRSGLAANFGITVLNAPGIIDPGYRGEVGVVLFNSSRDPFIVAPGDRIAQLVITRLVSNPSLEHDEFFLDDPTSRGTGGFGSTGLNGDAA